MLGYLLAGVVVGPFSLGVVAANSSVEGRELRQNLESRLPAAPLQGRTFPRQ
jgi:hypothetical protein